MNRLFFALLLCLQASAVPLTLSQANGKPGTLRALENGTYELHIAGGLSLYADSKVVLPKGPLVLEFDYFCLGGVPRFAVIPGEPFESKNVRWSNPLGHSEGWTPHRIRLNKKGLPLPPNTKHFRFDLPIKKETTLRFRNLKIRPEQAGEFDGPTKSHADTTENLTKYLDAKFPAQIKKVTVTKTQILISGCVDPQNGPSSLAEVPMEFLLDDPERFVHRTPIPDNTFSITLPRFVEKNDRLDSRWQIIDAKGKPLSHLRYADDIPCRSPDLAPAKPKSKKGLGGWSARRKPHGELEALDIAAVTVNVMVNSLISTKPSRNTFPITWQGRTYHANRGALERYDQTFREAAKRKVMVSGILLIANHARSGGADLKLMGHPDAVREGTFAMPNVTSRDGLDFYGAALNLMAERWTRPDGEFGRVHHWIVHNEVDAGWTWTNCGKKELLPFVDLYYRSVRLVHLITRQYDPHARAFLSLTHHWAHTVRPEFHPSKDILEIFTRLSKAEGDFPWALAHHPYPQSLRNPRTWEDRQATDSFDTKKITPHNIQVLDRWMKTPAMRYLGKYVRPVHLSENGFNSPNYDEKSLHDQAAGMAYAWKKINALDSIESWQYHNWIDNRHEGGLRIGLRKFPDEPGDPYGKKPIWYLYKALATPEENKATQPYLDYIERK